MRRFFFSTIKHIAEKLLATFQVGDQNIPTTTVMGPTEGVEIGALTPVYADGSFDIVSNVMEISAQTTPVQGDQNWLGEKIFTDYKDTLYFRFKKTTTGTTRFLAGLDFNGEVLSGNPTALIAGVRMWDGMYVSIFGNLILIGQYVRDDTYELKISLGGYDEDGNLTGDLRFGYYVYIREVSDRWRLLAKFWASHYVPTTNLGAAATTWEDFPPAGGTLAPSIVGGFIRMYDNITTLNNQVRIRTLAYILGDDQKIIWTVVFDELNTSAQWDSGDTGNVFILASEVGDDFISEAGISFPIVHPVYDVRAQIWFQQSQSYDGVTNFDFELWKVVDDGSNFRFIRIWTGTGITYGTPFEFAVEYHLNAGHTAYICDMFIDGVQVVTGESVGMANDTGGNGSIVVQGKGTATNPVDGTLQLCRQVVIPNHRFLLSNFSADVEVNEVKVINETLSITTDYSGTPIEGTTFEHSINCFIDLMVDVYSATEALIFAFRYVDSSNHYFINVSTAGVITLQRKLAGVDLIMNTSAVNAKNGTRLQLKLADDVATLFIDNVLGFQKTGIVSFPTEQTFNFVNVPADATIRNMVVEKINDPNPATAGTITLVEVTSTPADNGSRTTTTVPIPVPVGASAGHILVIMSGDRSGGPTFTVSAAANQTWTKIRDFSNSSMYMATYNGSFAGATTIDMLSNGAGFCTSGFCFVFSPPSAGTWSLDAEPLDYLTPSNTIHNLPGVEVSSFQTVSLALWIVGSARTWGTLTGTGWAVAGSAQYRNLGGSDRTYTFAYKACGGRGYTGVVGKTVSGAATQTAAMMVTFRHTP